MGEVGCAVRAGRAAAGMADATEILGTFSSRRGVRVMLALPPEPLPEATTESCPEHLVLSSSPRGARLASAFDDAGSLA